MNGSVLLYVAAVLYIAMFPFIWKDRISMIVSIAILVVLLLLASVAT